MGGDGTNTDGELGELHLSAISEAMNQMMGSAATSLSSMLNRKIDISPPNATVINLQEDIDEAEIDSFLTGKKSGIWLTVQLCSCIRFHLQRICVTEWQKQWKWTVRV